MDQLRPLDNPDNRREGPMCRCLLWGIAAVFRPKLLLIADNIWLRKQLVVLHRRNPHPRPNNANRGFWILACRWLPAWRTSLLIVKPETVLRWHRQGWRTYWRSRSRRRRALGIAAVFRPKLLAALTQAFYHVNP